MDFIDLLLRTLTRIEVFGLKLNCIKLFENREISIVNNFFVVIVKND